MNIPDWNDIIDTILDLLETETSSKEYEPLHEENTQQ